MTPFDTLVDSVRTLEAGTRRLEVLTVRRAALASAFDAAIVEIDAAHLAGRSAAALIRRVNRLDRLISLIDQRSLTIVRTLHVRLGGGHDAA